MKTTHKSVDGLYEKWNQFCPAIFGRVNLFELDFTTTIIQGENFQDIQDKCSLFRTFQDNFQNFRNFRNFRTAMRSASFSCDGTLERIIYLAALNFLDVLRLKTHLIFQSMFPQKFYNFLARIRRKYLCFPTLIDCASAYNLHVFGSDRQYYSISVLSTDNIA